MWAEGGVDFQERVWSLVSLLVKKKHKDIFWHKKSQHAKFQRILSNLKNRTEIGTYASVWRSPSIHKCTYSKWQHELFVQLVMNTAQNRVLNCDNDYFIPIWIWIFQPFRHASFWQYVHDTSHVQHNYYSSLCLVFTYLGHAEDKINDLGRTAKFFWTWAANQGLLCKISSWTESSVITGSFTPNDKFQISPAASPQILHHTVRRSWLFMAYLSER